MKAKEVSVSVAAFHGELSVIVTFKLPGHTLPTEPACPDPIHADATKFGRRVHEAARKAKAKELKRILEAVEFSDG